MGGLKFQNETKQHFQDCSSFSPYIPRELGLGKHIFGIGTLRAFTWCGGNRESPKTETGPWASDECW
jgi:hypothetical protein